LLIVNIDDLGYGDIEPFGSVLNRTPNLDRLASEEAMLTSFYAAPVCSPSRASLMTGCYPKRVLPLAQNVHYPGDSVGLSPNEITIAELLKNQGYVTGIVGKWHFGDQPDFLPTRQGFDYYFGIPYSNDMGTVEDGVKNNLGASPGRNPGSSHVWAGGYPPIPYIRNEKFVQRVLAKDQQECVERYTNEALNFIQNNYEKPYFLYLAHTAVHWPLYPGKAFVGKSKNGLYGDWVEEVD
jgi:arylsulfatase A